MEPIWECDGNKIYQGHVLEVLKGMSGEHLDKVWLYKKYITEKLSIYKIAKLVNRDPKRVYQKLIDFKIRTRSISEAMSGNKNFKYKKPNKKPTNSTITKPYHDKLWLHHQYTIMCKPANQIAKEQGCKENNILYFIKKHNIPCRTTQQIRQIKHWGLSGEKNGMYGRCGEFNPNWRGGITPERQLFYVSEEWKRISKIIWKRDKYTCQKCKCKKKSSKSFHIHHIVPFENIELRADKNNLILLCKDCHNWVHSKENKKGEYIETILVSR